MGDDLYTVTSAAGDDPISLKDTKDFLRIDSAITEDDALIQSLIKAAVIDGEKFCNRVFVTRTFLGKFQQLDRSQFEEWPFVQIRRAPLITVSPATSPITSVQVMFGDVLVDVDADDWQLKETHAFSRLLFVDSTFSIDNVPYPLEIAFTAGYGDAKDVPDDIKTALLQHVLYLYENRGDVQPEGKLTMPMVTKAIYTGNYRILNTYG